MRACWEDPSSDAGRPLGSMGRGDVFAGKRRSAAEKELLHLLHQELLGLRGPGLQAVFVQKHLLAVDPLGPGLFETFL